MAEVIVINTGPLITLGRIDALSVAGQLPYRFICPAEVRAELDVGEAHGHMRIAPPWLEVNDNGTVPGLLESLGLDAGEAAVIHLALSLGARVCIDEWKGRRAAVAAGLKVTGVLGLLGRAKALGLIPALGPYLSRAVEQGIRYHPELVRSVLAACGEGPPAE